MIRTLADLEEFLVECRDSHLGNWSDANAVTRVGDQEFHDRCIEQYQEAIDTLAKHRRRLAVVWPS